MGPAPQVEKASELDEPLCPHGAPESSDPLVDSAAPGVSWYEQPLASPEDLPPTGDAGGVS